MTIHEMLESLRQQAPAALLKTKESQGTKIPFLPWYGAVALADARIGGRWSHEIVEHWTDAALRGSKNAGYSESALAHVRVRVTLHGDDCSISREAVGVDDEPTGQRGTPLERAEASGLRRALAKFGLGLHLYGGADAHQAQSSQSAAQRQSAPAPDAPDHWTPLIAGAKRGLDAVRVFGRIVEEEDNPFRRANAARAAAARFLDLMPDPLPATAIQSTIGQLSTMLSVLEASHIPANQAAAHAANGETIARIDAAIVRLVAQQASAVGAGEGA